MDLGGFVGEARYAGNLDDFLPLLLIGEYVHEEFDLSFQPSIDERQLKELATLGFVSGAANVILLGPPGVGKTRLAVGLGIKAIEQGHGVCFIRAEALIEDLRRAMTEHTLDRRMRVYITPKVLIIDEFGIWPYDRLAATALVLPHLRQIRARKRHPDLQQGLRGVGRRPRRLRDRHGHPRPPAPSQPHRPAALQEMTAASASGLQVKM
jgi:hypothetical protein